MSMSIPFERGQIFVSADPRDEGRRLIVLEAPHFGAPAGEGAARVATIAEDGRHVRQRWVNVAQFHDTAVTAAGEVRKRGYVLESEW